jgi:hypothetical protein
MVKHHILIGLGFKKNIRNRALNYMMNRGRKAVSNFIGSALPPNQMTTMPVTRPVARRPLKFNY